MKDVAADRFVMLYSELFNTDYIKYDSRKKMRLKFIKFRKSYLFKKVLKKSNFRYTRLMPFRVSRVSGAHFREFTPEITLQGCSGDESLAACWRFDRLWI